MPTSGPRNSACSLTGCSAGGSMPWVPRGLPGAGGRHDGCAGGPYQYRGDGQRDGCDAGVWAQLPPLRTGEHGSESAITSGGLG